MNGIRPSTRRSTPGVVVITGASAGIGRATAVSFARRGWKVALIARGEAGLAAARREVELAGGSAMTLCLDVADAAALNAAADEVVARWSRIDVWVNNAMLTVFGRAGSVTAHEWDRVTQVTYLGAVHGALAALRHMRSRDRGTIVQVGSALAFRSIPLQAPYCAAKAALRGFTDALRCELLHDRSRIKLSMVHLPGVNTPQFGWSRTHMPARHRPVGTFYRPRAAAEAVLKAALTAPRELWVGLPVTQALLGNVLAPGLLDRLLARSAYEPQIGTESADLAFDILDAPASADEGTEGPFPSNARADAGVLDPAALRVWLAGLLVAVLAGWIGLRRTATQSGSRRSLAAR